jgi:hypothetical protein
MRGDSWGAQQLSRAAPRDLFCSWRLRYASASVVLVAMVIAAALGCSSKNSRSGDDDAGADSALITSCYADLLPGWSSGTCRACALAQCSLQVSDVEEACAAFSNCACPGGMFDAEAVVPGACQSDEGCDSAISELTSCEVSNCAAPECYIVASSRSSSGG